MPKKLSVFVKAEIQKYFEGESFEILHFWIDCNDVYYVCVKTEDCIYFIRVWDFSGNKIIEYSLSVDKMLVIEGEEFNYD